ncbi:GNAT family N-acetyltransferase [Fictibacillus aquaticus]|uniref:GNAT family N-acetyltransferase n=1 Tax=Fictibacillus aquaticus TaxID=2021314 RepID=A0A235F5W4_9BACL|nr:GNAT family N-acetyltransferase [Fictibacillus aquaticus]OYD56622.1 GNAT family N-acetyltransferase [Fictibacillus aquaticus]
MEYIVREAKRDDAQQIIEFYNKVGGESDFLSFGSDEFQRDHIEYGDYLENTRNEENSLILLALDGDDIISIATINSSQKVRTKHVGTLGIVVSKEHHGKGIGKKLMNDLIKWASGNGITKKITLVTREDNELAIALYKQLGFEIEGVLKRDTYIHGVYYNTLVMGLFL